MSHVDRRREREVAVRANVHVDIEAKCKQRFDSVVGIGVDSI